MTAAAPGGLLQPGPPPPAGGGQPRPASKGRPIGHAASPVQQQQQGSAPCCSFQTSLGPPEYRKWRRLHGFQLPLHPQQVAGWVTLAAFAAATFLVLVPALGPELRPSVLPVLACLFGVHAASHLAAVLLDPADAPLRRLRERTVVPEFDRSKHAHVIEHGRCHLCNIATSGLRTKHCSVCNKCVGRFDHHCKWLNHCVGGRNYAAFLVCVVSAVLTAVVVVAVAVAELVLYHVEPRWLSPWTYAPAHDRTASAPLSLFPDTALAFLVVVSALGVLAAVSAGLLLHLCLFHVYISVLGITTYEYIRRYRQLAAAGAQPSLLLPQPPPPPAHASPASLSVLTARNGALHSPNSSAGADVHSNVGTPLDASEARSATRKSVPARPDSLPRRVSFCCGPAVPTPTSAKTPLGPPSRSSTASTTVQSPILKPSTLSLDVEAGVPYTISYPGRDEAVEDTRCCASLRPGARRATTPSSAVNGGRGQRNSRSSSSTATSRSSEMSFRTGGYQQPEVTEYTGCECNPGRIPVGPPPPMARLPPPPRRPAQQRQQQSLLGRLCASFSAPNPRAGVAYPPALASLGSAGVRRNQVQPTAECPQARLMGKPGSARHNGRPHKQADDRPRRPSSANSNKYSPLPALPQPSRRRLQGVSLKELGNVLAYAQDPKTPPQQQPPPPQQQLQPVAAPRRSPQQVKQMQQQQQQLALTPRRHPSDPVRRAALTRSGRRRSSTPQPARPKSPTLSPIHESGLSNPPTPQRPRTARQTPDSEPAEHSDDEYAQSIMYIDEDEGTYFTASMSSMSSAMTPLTPLTPMTPLTPRSAAGGFWGASKEARSPASAL